MSGANRPAGDPQTSPAACGPDPKTAIDQTILHASCVSLHGRGALILGASGSGKSSLALGLMALGASLIADDRVCLTRHGQAIIACAPPPLAGLIEARGIGLLHADPGDPAAIACVIDLNQTETDRMPPPRHTILLGQTVTLLFRVETPHFPAALLQFLKAGRHEV
ncbi:MAG: HPr kinase/phosphorylase [Paracoccaceae bacterium]|jgi:HPr kinase/phosphorylase